MSDRAVDFDIVVIGAGPAGIAAAATAARAHARVALIDEAPWPGGQIWRGPKSTSHKAKWLTRLRVAGVPILTRTTVIDAPAPQTLLAEAPDGPLSITWKQLILATGARELFLPFPGWTLPGVFGVGGLQGLVKTGWPIAGRRVVIAGSGPLLLAVADGLRAAGARVMLVAEQAPWSRVRSFAFGLFRQPGKLAQAAALKWRLRGIHQHFGTWPIRAEGENGVERVVLSDGRDSWTVVCDALACGFGLGPNTELAALLGCDLRDGFVHVDEFQQTTRANVFCAGEPTGIGGIDAALVEGCIAGAAAGGRADEARRWFRARARQHAFRDRLQTAFALDERLAKLAAPDTLVCRCEDVRYDVVSRYQSWREAKLLSRCGMGPCQGRVCGGAAHVLFGWEVDSIRPPVLPARLSTYLDS
jgi:NADPH-dependent 2,4-dienoyl-CoA reductase/sulfur reductase-like enzyme